MIICMTGLDHKSASLSVREKFAVGREKARRVIGAIKENREVSGCVIMSTCNRTEVYVSAARAQSVTGLFCGALGLDPGQYARHFTEREGDEAFCHLCRVGAGVDSQILGDDQIVTQVRQSVELSREYGYNDAHLETAFRLAVQAAKEIKTRVTVRSERMASAPFKAVKRLKAAGPLAGKSAVVIGNGQMGRLAASLLISESAAVTVTLREYKKGAIDVPRGADSIGYGRRYEAIENADIVISATTSPHFTLHYDDLARLAKRPETIADLAVPRDVDPKIGELDGVTLLTIDDLGDDGEALPPEKLAAVGEIVGKNLQNYNKWREYKEKLV